ncbi:MAG: bifunctional metallophosphatase/5'-nucleotidase [Bacteroidota bacterium]
MQRRNFIKTTTTAGVFLGISGLGTLSSFQKNPNTKQLTVLHTNDVHSHIDSFPKNHSKYPDRGGVARRLTYFEKVKKENPNVLILDAGDSFQGTPYFNFYGGELEFKLMSKLGYHASTIGNHEFDEGIDNIAAQLQHAEFSMLNANYDFKNTSLDGLVQPYKIYQVNGLKIGVFGIGIELDGLVSKKLYKETQYLNPIEIASDISHRLKNEENCHLVICLSHLGYKYNSDKIDDHKLAQQTENIDLIIGGHTHTFLEKPTIVSNKNGNEVLINQVGWAGLNVGRIDFYFEETNSKSETRPVLEL